VPHDHVVDLEWYRSRAYVSCAFAPGWDVTIEFAHDVKDVRADYVLPDGTHFDNPFGDVHHRTETLSGLSDVRILFSRHLGSFHVGAGLSFPFGRIEEDPFELGRLGIRHQHIQFGTGTVDPLLHASYGWTSGPWGISVNASAHVPLYYGPKGYKAATVLDYSAGPSYVLADWISLSVQYVGVYQSRAYWGNDVDPNSGYLLHGIALAVPIRVGTWTIRPMVIRVLDIDVPDGDSFTMDWMFSLTLEKTFD
jgi:hypothetical protein